MTILPQDDAGEEAVWFCDESPCDFGEKGNVESLDVSEAKTS